MVLVSLPGGLDLLKCGTPTTAPTTATATTPTAATATTPTTTTQ
jgi:hypothetical protein